FKAKLRECVEMALQQRRAGEAEQRLFGQRPQMRAVAAGQDKSDGRFRVVGKDELRHGPPSSSCAARCGDRYSLPFLARNRNSGAPGVTLCHLARFLKCRRMGVNTQKFV